MLRNRREVEKLFEQELSSLLLQSIKIAEKEGKQEARETLKIVLKVISERREERERTGADEL
jgi:hypothetical protein